MQARSTIAKLLWPALVCVAGEAVAPATAAPAAPAQKQAAPGRSAQASTQLAMRNQAVALYNNKDYRGAAQMLDQYLALYKNDYYAAYYAAMANQQIGNSNQSRIYYRMVYSLAPTSQLGGYAKALLLKIDPTFAGSQSAASAPDLSTDAPASLATIAPVEEQLDPSMPKECRIRYEKGLANIILDAYMDDRPLKMIFDTGAPNVVVGKNQIAAIGGILPTGKPDGYTGGSSNSGVIPYWMVTSKIKVGTLERKMPVQVLSSNASPPLIGQTFFKGYDYTIDSGGGELVFRQKSLTAKNGPIRNAVTVPFIFRPQGNRIIVEVEVNGKKGPMIFDSGNTSCPVVFRSFGDANLFAVKIPDDAVRQRHSGVSGSGSALHFQVNRIKLGPIDRSYVEVAVNEGMEDPEGLPLLGQPFWQGYEYTIDMDHKLIHFVRR